MPKHNGEVKNPGLIRATIVLRDTKEGKFTAEVVFKPSVQDKNGELTERAKKSPAYWATKRLLEVVTTEFQKKPEKSVIIFPGR